MEENQGVVDNLPLLAQKLTPVQQKFCQNLALYDNVLKAGKLAGYSVDNTNNGGLYHLANRPDIQAAVQYWRDHYANTTETSPEKTITTLANMAHAPIYKALNNQWDALPQDQIPQEILEAIVGVEVKETKGQRRVTLKFAREFALEQLMKLHRLGVDDSAGKDGLTLTLNLGVQQITQVKQEDSAPQDTIDIAF